MNKTQIANLVKALAIIDTEIYKIDDVMSDDCTNLVNARKSIIAVIEANGYDQNGNKK